MKKVFIIKREKGENRPQYYTTHPSQIPWYPYKHMAHEFNSYEQAEEGLKELMDVEPWHHQYVIETYYTKGI